MKTMPRFACSLVLGAAVALSGVLFSSGSFADWPMARHDPQRRAAATNLSRLSQPVRAWSYYQGGRIESRNMVAADVNGNGVQDIVLVTGGRLVVKRPDDAVLWETSSYGFRSIAAVEDLNADGELEIVAVGFPAVVAIFGGRDGRLLWRTSSDTFGPNLGAVRVADLNGDGSRDLYVAEANCGSVGQRGDLAYAYTFGRGFGSGVEDMQTRLWQLERGRDYVCGVNDVAADMNGDGATDIVTFSSGTMWLYDGHSGQKIPSGDMARQQGYSLGFSVPYGVLTTDVVDLNNDRRPEIVAYTDNNYAPAINSRSVLAIEFDPMLAQADRLRVKWRVGVGDLVMHSHAFVDSSAADLDGDGSVEIVSTFITAGGPTTYVRRGSDGAELIRIAGTVVRGIVDSGPGLTPTVLVQRGAAIEGYRFAALAMVPMGGMNAGSPAFSLPDGLSVVTRHALNRGQRGSAVSVVATVPEADGMHRALVVSNGQRVSAWNIRGPAPMRLGEFDLGEGLTLGVVQQQNNVSAMGEGLLLTRSDGVLVVLDREMHALNLGSGEVPLPGVRFGGYYSGACGTVTAPIAGRLEGMADSVLSVNSQGQLLRIDAAMATRVRPPAITWRWNGAQSPLLHDVDGDGALEIVADTGGLTLNAREADGRTELWRRAIGMRPTETRTYDIVPVIGHGAPRFATYALDNSDGTARAYMVNNQGMTLFATPPTVVAGSGLGAISTLDIDNDAREDFLVSQAGTMYLFAGNDGREFGRGISTHPIMNVVTAGRTGTVQLITGGAHYSLDGVRMTQNMANYSPTSAWQLPGAMYPAGSTTFCFGAVVQCPGGLRYAQALASVPRVVVIEASTGRLIYDVAVANGRTFATEMELRAAVPTPGLLTNINATQSLDGMDTPSFLFGSTEGRLYALNACSDMPQIRWSMDFRAPVGEPIFADTDGDRQDEIVVTSADGFIHGLDTQLFPAPAYVFETDPPRVAAVDVDDRTGSSVEAIWAEVPGATAYEWALFTAGGSAVSRGARPEDGPFIRTMTRSAFWNEGLLDGAQYFFAVRAVGPMGESSVEALSNGVIFHRGVAQPDSGVLTDASASVDSSIDDAQDSGANSRMDGAVTDSGSPTMGSGCGCRVVQRSSLPRSSAVLALSAVCVALSLVRSRRRAFAR